LWAGSRRCWAAVAAAAVPGGLLLGARGPLGLVLHPQGAHRESSARSVGGARAATDGGSASTGPTHSHKNVPEGEEGRRTHHPRGAHDAGRGKKASSPGAARTRSSYPFLGHRSLRFPGDGAAGAPRPRVPKTWIRERATAVRQITISSHRSMHSPGRTRGGGELVAGGALRSPPRRRRDPHTLTHKRDGWTGDRHPSRCAGASTPGETHTTSESSHTHTHTHTHTMLSTHRGPLWEPPPVRAFYDPAEGSAAPPGLLLSLSPGSPAPAPAGPDTTMPSRTSKRTLGLGVPRTGRHRLGAAVLAATKEYTP
jgi:hypothetical protein